MGRLPTAVTLPRILDVSNLLIAYMSFSQYVDEKLEENPDFFATPEGHKVQAALTLAEPLMRRYRPVAVAGIDQYLKPLVETHHIPQMSVLFKKVQFLNDSGDLDRGLFLYRIFRRMGQDKRILTETFTATSRVKAQALMLACAETNLPARVNKIAGIAPGSGLQVAKVWIEKAAEALGAPVTDTESVMTDAETAATLGTEMGKVVAKINVTEPNTEEAADLHVKKTRLSRKIQTVADSSKSPEAVLGAAAVAVEKGKVRSPIATQLNLSASQEDALLTEGRVIIAAAAGSGKTKTVAGKVVYTIKELGIPPQRIIATSFSSKSAYELKDRIKKFGGEGMLEGAGATDGMGTTHSISLKICRSFRKDLNAGNIIEDYEDAKLIRTAMKQVEMRAYVTAPEPPADEDLLGVYSGVGSQNSGVDHPVTQETMIPGEKQTQSLEAAFDEAMSDVTAYAARSSGGIFYWFREKGAGFLPDMVRKGWGLIESGRMSPRQREILEKAFAQAHINYRFPTPDEIKASKGGPAAPVVPVVPAGEEGSEDLIDKNNNGLDEGGPDFTNRMAAYGKNLQSLEYLQKNPANQWFNLGAKLVDENGRPLGFKSFAGQIGRWQADIIAPGKALADSREAAFRETDRGEDKDIYVAVYGAYSWLKKNTMETSGRLTFDDMLIEATRTLVHDDRVRGMLQEQYKYIIVDEAQDQNMLQHLLFGLLSGYYDPKTRAPNADGHMTATTYCMVGDSDQAIYPFRGARPEEFINKSDTQGGDFQTKMLEMNYRSGSDIVEAAHRLIKHNQKRIPMTCVAYPKKGTGHIKAVSTATNETGAAYMAEVISDQLKDGVTTPGDFGVAVRTNAEAYAYTIELLKRNIPFRSKIDLFNDESAKAIIYWLRLVDADTTAEVNDAVINAYKAPMCNLDTVFVDKVKAGAKGQNYLDWLSGGGYKRIYEDKFDKYGRVVSKQEWRNEKNVLPYVKNLLKIKALSQAGLKPVEVFNEILQLEGSFGSIIQSLVDRVKKDPDALDLIRSETDTGAISDEAIEALALAPLKPLQSMLEGHEALTPALDFVKQLQDANKKSHKKDDVRAPDYQQPAVMIDTCHGWKGLEVKHLFTSMAKGTFPHARTENIEDERRLAYVAITRGEDNVTILCPEVGINGKPAGPSQFLAEACIPVEGIDDEDKDAPEDTGMDKVAYTDEELEQVLLDADGMQPTPEEELDQQWEELPDLHTTPEEELDRQWAETPEL